MTLEELKYKMAHGPFQASYDDIELFQKMIDVIEAAEGICHGMFRKPGEFPPSVTRNFIDLKKEDALPKALERLWREDE